MTTKKKIATLLGMYPEQEFNQLQDFYKSLQQEHQKLQLQHQEAIARVKAFEDERNFQKGMIESITKNVSNRGPLKMNSGPGHEIKTLAKNTRCEIAGCMTCRDGLVGMTCTDKIPDGLKIILESLSVVDHFELTRPDTCIIKFKDGENLETAAKVIAKKVEEFYN
jgi:hypothetical protein